MDDINPDQTEHDVSRRRVRVMPRSTDRTKDMELHEMSDNANREIVVAGTSVQDMSGTEVNLQEGHPVPVILIEDHFAEVAQGINPATCKVCGAPMELHAQFEPTMQHYEEDAPVESISSHLASAHGLPDLGELDPVEDGLILDRLNEIHMDKHAMRTLHTAPGVTERTASEAEYPHQHGTVTHLHSVPGIHSHTEFDISKMGDIQFPIDIPDENIVLNSMEELEEYNNNINQNHIPPSIHVPDKKTMGTLSGGQCNSCGADVTYLRDQDDDGHYLDTWTAHDGASSGDETVNVGGGDDWMGMKPHQCKTVKDAPDGPQTDQHLDGVALPPGPGVSRD